MLSSACAGDNADSGDDGGNVADSGSTSGDGGGNSSENGSNSGDSGGNNNNTGGTDGDRGDNADTNPGDGGDKEGDGSGDVSSGADGENNTAGSNAGDGGSSDGSGSPGSESGSGSGGDGGSGSSSGGDSGNGGGNGSGGGDSGGGGGSGNGSDGGNSSGGGAAGLSGTPTEILDKLVSEIQAAGVGMPMSLPPTEVTPDLSQSIIGLSEADFGKLVESAAYNLAAIGTFAHQIIVIKAKDAASAAEVKRLVSGDNGYDVYKWICVWPKKAAAVDSGVYVLLVASENEVVDAAIKAFEKLAGSIGSVNNFWEHTDGDLGGDIGGGIGGGFPIGDLPFAG